MSEQLPADPAPTESGAQVDTDPSAQVERPKGHPMMVYTLVRLGLFVVFTAIVLLFVHNVLIAALLGAIISGIVSFFLLNKLRDKASVAVAPTVDGMKQKMAARRDEEDAAAEAMRVEQARARGEEPPVADGLVD